jgi:rod shape-determining protein MreD
VIARALISFVAVGIAVIVQLTIVNRIAFPGGTGPDVVLLAVAALALADGPMIGALIGFSAGLALDVAPPGSYLVGENALVFCLIGYLCGLAREVPNSEGVPEQGHTALFEIVVVAVAAVCGEALTVALGKMLSDPRISVPAVRHVLPVAVAYDLLLSPFVLFAAAAVLRLAGPPRSERDRAAWAMPAARPAGTTQGAIREMNGGNTPRLRLSESGKGEGLGSGRRGRGATGLATARREPRLKLGHGGPLGDSRLGAAFTAGGSRRGSGLSSGAMAGALGGGAAKVKFAAHRGEGMLGGALNPNLARSRLTSSRFGRSRMGRSLLGGSVFSRSSPVLHPTAPPRRLAPISRSSFLGRSPFLRRPPVFGRSSALGRSSASGRSSALGRSSASGRSSVLGRSSASGRSSVFGRSPVFGRSLSLLRSPALGRTPSLSRTPSTGHASRATRPGPLARLTSALRRSVRPQPRLRQRRPAFRTPIRAKAPGRGWLRRSSMRRDRMARGWTGGRTPRLGTRTPRLHMPRPRAKRRWRTGGYR